MGPWYDDARETLIKRYLNPFPAMNKKVDIPIIAKVLETKTTRFSGIRSQVTEQRGSGDSRG